MANVIFEFSTMNHPTAEDASDSETWTKAQGFFKAALYWELGHTPDWIDCYFHAAQAREFPWVRVRATDENGPIGIWRFDTIEEQFEGGSRQWRATGRDALYGVVDNYLRSPRIKAEEDPDNDDDPGYTEWPIIPPASLFTYEDLLAEDKAAKRTVDCKRMQDETGCGGSDDPCTLADALSTTIIAGGSQFLRALPCVFATNDDRDAFLDNNFAESRFNQETDKLGPNYSAKGVRRGWVFKDIMRHASGSVGTESRPILAVYNRSLGGLGSISGEGSVINSNFQQSQAAGAGASALAYDVAVSWPWLTLSQDAVESVVEPANNSGADTGYDYRTVWTGKSDTYAGSGQAIEVFRRGSQEWDDAQGFGCGGNNIPCPGEAPAPVVTVLTYFQATILKHVELDHFPTRAEICEIKPIPESKLIGGMGVIVTVIDTRVADYDLTAPSSLPEWLNRLRLAPLRGPGLNIGGQNGTLICCRPIPTCEAWAGENIAEGGQCWCLSHFNPILTSVALGLVGVWMTPLEPISARIDPAPGGKQCAELSLTSNMGVFLHRTDTSKDYLCYHELADD